MSSRDFTKHLVSSTSPTNTRVGDEYYDPVTNKLYKKLAVNGTTVTNVEIAQASTFSTTIGDGTNTVYTVSHNLGKTNIIPSVRESGSGSIVYPTIKYLNSNQISFTFVTAPAANFYNVTIAGF